MEALRRAVKHLESLREADGGWEAEMVWNTMLLRQYVIVRRVCNTFPLPARERTQIIRHFEVMTQLPAGSWPMHRTIPPCGVAAVQRLPQTDGTWPREAQAGVFFTTSVLDYLYYRSYLPTLALARYAKHTQRAAGATHGHNVRPRGGTSSDRSDPLRTAPTSRCGTSGKIERLLMTASAHPLIDPARALVHRKSLVGFRAACEQLWGDAGCRALAEVLPEQVRERTAGLLPLAEWLPLGDLIAWHNAVWEGPVKRDRARMKEHARVVIDQGFGRVKRFVLSMATPHTLVPRVAAMWRDEYSSGTLTAEAEDARTVTLSLREHPYVDNALMRFVIAEAFRHVVSLTKVKNVTEQHSVRDRSLVIVLGWD